MTRITGLTVVFLLSCAMLAESLSTVLVYDDDSDNATIQSCMGILESGDVLVHPYRVNVAKSLEAIRSDVCTRMALADDMAFILDYSRVQAVNSLLGGLSQQLQVPHLRMASSFQPELGGHDFQLQVYPGLVQLLLLKDFLRKERMEGRWKEATVVLPTKTGDLQNFARLMPQMEQPMMIRKWMDVMEENNAMVEEFAKRGMKNFIVGLAPEHLMEFFSLMSAKGMLTFVHRYLLTHPEASSAKLSGFVYSGAHIIAFRPKLGSGDARMIVKMTGIAKNLTAPLKSFPPTNWRPRCSGPGWTGGRKAMDAVLRRAEASHGLLRRGENETCPCVDFQFGVEELTTGGYTEMMTWRGNGGFRVLESKLRGKRQAKRTHLTVSTILRPPFTMYDERSKQYSGLVIDILSEIGNQLSIDFTYTQVKDGLYGRKVGDKWNGMIGEVVDRKVDLAAAALTVTFEREKVVDFTYPFAQVGLVLLAKKPEIKSTNWTAFVQPFSNEVWILVIVAIILTSLALFVAARLSPAEWHHSNATTKVNQFTLANCFWFVTGAALFRGTNLYPRAIGTRLVSLAWWFFILLLVVAYAVSVQYFLALDRDRTPIKNVEDLSQQARVKYGTLKGGASYAFFKDSKAPTYQRMFTFMTSVNSFATTVKEGVDRVLKDDYVFILESLMAEYYKARQCGLTVLGDKLNARGYAFAFQNKSPYKDAFNGAILQLQRKQVLDELMQKWIYRYKVRQPCEEYDIGDRLVGREFTLTIFSGLLVGLLVGLIIALVICILEIIVRSCRERDRGERSFKDYLVHRVQLVFCTFNGKEVEEKTDSSASQELA